MYEEVHELMQLLGVDTRHGNGVPAHWVSSTQGHFIWLGAPDRHPYVVRVGTRCSSPGGTLAGPRYTQVSLAC
jgi:hypothetical protein